MRESLDCDIKLDFGHSHSLATHLFYATSAPLSNIIPPAVEFIPNGRSPHCPRIRQ